MADILYIVVPCYNEEAVLPETSRRLREKLEALMAAGKIAAKSRVLFVNDGSKDRTWELISSLHGECPLFCGVDLSRNRGHQNALLAGLMTAKERCDMAISMDADLQDDVDAVDAMVEEYYAGCDIVYGVRSARKKDTFFKRFTAEGFYRLMNFMGAETVFNHADYRLMSKRALEGLAQFKEVNLFLRGIVPMIGYRTGTVEYERGERFAGESKYPLKKMVSFAMEGITSLSTKPIRYITGLGFLIFLVSILMLIYSIVRWAMGDTIIGWASMICSVWAIGGLILLSLGVIGEYIGKIYLETKGRPRFLIQEVLEDTDDAPDYGKIGMQVRMPEGVTTGEKKRQDQILLIREVIASLSPESQKICRLLSTECSVSEIARRTALTRKIVRLRIESIKTALLEAGVVIRGKNN